MEDQLLTVELLAKKLNLKKSWIYHRTRQKGSGRIPHYRAGKYCRFDLQEVLMWLKKQQGLEAE